MPYKIIKIRNQNKYKVVNVDSGRVMSKHTSKQNAIKQVRYLEFLRFKKREK